MHLPARIATRSAIIGGLVWVVLLFVRTTDSSQTELIVKILFLGILVIVPLGLSLVDPSDRTGIHSTFYSWAVLAQPVGAIISIGSFLFEQGILAAAVASVWLLENILIAVYGASRFWSRGLLPVQEACIDAGLFYLPVSGAAFFFYRLGVQPFEFGETIILLTAVHFHFAGFAAPIVIGMTGRLLATRSHPAFLFKLTAASVIGAMPLIAAGITLSPRLALLGTLLLSFGLGSLGVLTIGWVLPAVVSIPSKVLLTISVLSTSVAMVLACLYAYSIVTKTVILDIPGMATTHGLLNSFGFCLLSLLVWNSLKPRETF